MITIRIDADCSPSKHGTQSSIKLDQCLTFWAEENYRKSKQRCHRPTSWVWSTGEKSHTACTRNLQTAMPLWAKSGFSGMTKEIDDLGLLLNTDT
ncbi:hypothetical protein RRG08_042699 [Elysia crispata]|uniref:Uncharacterized protein n=1 Tax=Elysia crispata TaxID=231223 RepID=A0AAE1CKF4_9GAST|nr:hypothetical protein RRG08_042699 [Elysia crispata]